MPKYKLIYFDIRARGEIIRMLFSVAGVEFEDFRVKMKPSGLEAVDEWEEIKKKTPFGQLPILAIDGVEELTQSHAIERYLAREFGLDGGTSLEKGKVDMWIGAADEIIRRLSDNVEIFDTKLRAEDTKKIKAVSIPFVLGTLNKTLTTNKSGFIVGDTLTVADLAFVSVRDWLGCIWPEDGLAQLTPYKQVSDHMERISKIPAIAEWRKKRPDSKY